MTDEDDGCDERGGDVVAGSGGAEPIGAGAMDWAAAAGAAFLGIFASWSVRNRGNASSRMARAPHVLLILSLTWDDGPAPELLTLPEPTDRPAFCLGGVDSSEEEDDELLLTDAFCPDLNGVCFFTRFVPFTFDPSNGEDDEELDAGDPFIGAAGVVLILTPALDSLDVGFLLIVSLLPLRVVLYVVWDGILLSAGREYFPFSGFALPSGLLLSEQLLSGRLEGPAADASLMSSDGGELVDGLSPGAAAGFTLLLSLSMTALSDPFGFFTAAAAAAAAAFAAAFDNCCCCSWSLSN